VALTFDDGPWPGGTDRIVEVLGAHGVRATFFVWGEQALAHPELVQEALDAGHSIEPHCWSHCTSYRHRPHETIREDIDRVLALLVELGAPTPRLWRPPWGEWLRGANDVLAGERGLELNGWTIDSGDWTGMGVPAMRDRVTAGLEESPGAITSVLLMHDGPREPGQWEKRQNVDGTVELVRLLLADEALVCGPQVEAVSESLAPPLG
jgi:peptidoglycan/xylan/chitin deacetylase (PgdA/CDA1 family)